MVICTLTLTYVMFTHEGHPNLLSTTLTQGMSILLSGYEYVRAISITSPQTLLRILSVSSCRLSHNEGIHY